MSLERNQAGVAWLLSCVVLFASGCSSGGNDSKPEQMPPVNEPPPVSPVVISELMYHPVGEEDADEHEFIELANRSQSNADISGWKLSDAGGALSYTFPAGTELMAGGYLVVAKNRTALASVWELDPARTFGDYAGALDNGGETVMLTNARGAVADSVSYADSWPWPAAADELGVGEDWLKEDERPISKHRFKGRSLERIDLNAPSNDPATWEASALDAATPGRPNGVAKEVVALPIDVTWSPVGGSGHTITASDSVRLSFAFSRGIEVKRAELRYFVDDLTRSGEPLQTLPLELASSGRYEVTLPPQPENSLVRYQVWSEAGSGSVQVMPRASDPLPFRSYFVAPSLTTASRVYHLFVNPADWSKLESSLTGSDIKNCAPSAEWDANYPAAFVYDGQVYDVVASYSGSRYQRENGAAIASWPYSGPQLPNGRRLSALSWKIKFPRSQRFEQQRAIKLNKMYQGFPGINSLVESELLKKAGLISYGVRFARLHINGGYYHYVAEMEDINEDLLEKFLPKGEPMGELFKADGSNDGAGLLPRGDFTPVGSGNGECASVSAETRYAATYQRINYDYRGPGIIIELITALDRAAASGVVSEAVKSYFNQYWDVDALLKTFAIRNWCGVWDDTFHNVFPYRRGDGKWLLIQQDFDWDFGLGSFGNQPSLSTFRADQTFYIGAYKNSSIGQTCELSLSGEQRSRCNNLGFSRLKDTFIQNFRAEFDATLRSLSKTVLEPNAVQALIEQSASQFNQADWDAAPASKSFCGSGANQVCSFPNEVAAMKQWATDRNAALQQRLGM
jgi:spore coat protein CotH